MNGKQIIGFFSIFYLTLSKIVDRTQNITIYFNLMEKKQLRERAMYQNFNIKMHI